MVGVGPSTGIGELEVGFVAQPLEIAIGFGCQLALRYALARLLAQTRFADIFAAPLQNFDEVPTKLRSHRATQGADRLRARGMFFNTEEERAIIEGKFGGSRGIGIITGDILNCASPPRSFEGTLSIRS